MREYSIWVYVQDNGDGSASPMFFATEADAYAYKEASEEAVGNGWGEDCVYHETLQFDDAGILLNPQPKYDED